MASQQNIQKKPRLSLQIKTSPSPPARPRVHINPQDPTAFNTLSNSYVTAIERSTPLTAINTLAAFSLNTPVEYQDPKNRVATPYVARYPESPMSANPLSPQQPMQIHQFPSTMTATPPLSGTTDNESKVFTFSSMDTGEQPRQQRQQPKVPSLSIPTERGSPHNVVPYRTANQTLHPPYSQPRVLQSILRNSPLPPKTAIPPPSPRRQSLRLAEKAARRVCYNSPIEQEIITNKYTKSHIDLLAEEASPNTPGMPETNVSGVSNSQEVLDTALAFTPNEIQDGGQTPGPFEETRRRMAGFGPGSPSSPAGIRKRKKKEKKRRWVWTIGQADEDDGDEEVGGAMAAIRAEAARKKTSDEDDARTPRGPIPSISYSELPTPSVESSDSWSQSEDVEMTDCSSVASDAEDRLSVPPSEPELDLKTPTAPKPSGLESKRDTPIPNLNDERRDTPVPSQGDQRDTPVPPEYQ